MSDDTNCTGDGTTSQSCTLADLGADGSKSVYVACQDSPGNKDTADTNESLTYTLDATAPTTTDNFSNNDSWQSASQTITLTPADAGSGVSWTKYCTDTANSCDPASGTSYTTTVAVSTEGTSYFRYASQDNAGNTQTTVSRTVKIDTTAPVTALTTVRSNDNVTATLTCADTSGSGCSTTYYCIDYSSACTPTTLYTAPTTFSVTRNVYFRHYSTDYVLNTSSTAASEIQPGPGNSSAAQPAPSQTPVAENKPEEVRPPDPAQSPLGIEAGVPLSGTSSGEVGPLTKLAEQIQNIGEAIVGFLTPGPPASTPGVSEIETPEAFQGWDIMETKPIGETVLESVESDIGFFVEKIPQLKQALSNLGIDVGKISDAQKISGAELFMPGLTEVSMFSADINAGNFSAVSGIPLADLSIEAKQKIPTDIVFARTGGELIDYSIAVSVDKEGSAKQKIKTVSGKPMTLVIKPDQPAKKVTGFLALKKSAVGQDNSKNKVLGFISKISGASLLASMQTGQAPKPAEGSLLIEKFAYIEEDSGIYRADIQAPVAEGEYEISTVIEYKDESALPKETKMTAIVNPEGYVYNQMPDGRLRIKNASVSLYWQNPETKQFELWSAEKFLQKNPVVTDETGKYSFLAPKGTYKLKAVTLNYKDFESEPFEIKEDISVNRNIELFRKSGLLGYINWQMAIIILLIIITALLGLILFKKRLKF